MKTLKSLIFWGRATQQVENYKTRKHMYKCKYKCRYICVEIYTYSGLQPCTLITRSPSSLSSSCHRTGATRASLADDFVSSSSSMLTEVLATPVGTFRAVARMNGLQKMQNSNFESCRSGVKRGKRISKD